MGTGSSGHPLPDSVPAALARGSSIGRYIVLAMVGRGGMGEVYAAYDPELDRKVAVKLLRVKPGNGVSLAEGRTRTLREAQAIARLSHPNVVVAYDVGTFEDKVFIAMEYVEGNTVTYWLQVQERSWKEILDVFKDAARGLGAAHEKGLIHRDFKTDNVMISRDRHVRVMDFGLARQVQEKSGAAPVPLEASGAAGTSGAAPIPIRILTGNSAAALGGEGPSTVVIPTEAAAPIPIEGRSSSGTFDARLTRTGAMMGTPAYMAPEQFLGTPTDARSDQFSFCISLYEALYKERPFEGSTMSTLTSNVVHGNVREAPVGSKVPLWVRKVLLRGLKPRAKERWASMEALIEALEKDPSIKRRKWLAAAGGVGVIVAAALGVRALLADQNQICSGGPRKLAGIWDLQKPGEPEPARHAQIRKAFMATGKSYAPDVFATVDRALTAYAQSWASMHRENCEATQAREQSEEVMDMRMDCLTERLGGLRALTDVFSEGSNEIVENAVSAANALEPLDRCANIPLLRSVIRPPDDVATRGKVAALRSRLADVKAQHAAGRWVEMLKKGPALVDEARALGYQPLTTESLALLGMMLVKAKNPVAAEATLTEAFWAADASRHDEVRAEVAANLVYVVGFQEARFADAHRWATAAESVLNRMGGHDLLRAWLLNDLGAVSGQQGNKEAALHQNLEALALKKKVLGNRHPDVALSETNLATALLGLGRNEEALAHIDAAISISEEGLGTAHPDVALPLNNRGEILKLLGRYAEARRSFERARNIWEREIGPDSAWVAYALTGIGATYVAEGNPNSALVPLERAARILRDADMDPAARAETNFVLARALWDSNRDRGRARDLAEQARIDYAKTPAKDSLAEVERWLDRAQRVIPTRIAHR